MRENRTSGSEGGAAEPNRSSLPLSSSENRPQESLTALRTGACPRGAQDLLANRNRHIVLRPRELVSWVKEIRWLPTPVPSSV